ncbi:DUF881 domain-containing protein, partial [Patescibacteria group bacterium]|nr:DUF881 domain-containing protein [Patescibacteria group bacterium]
MVKEAQTSPIAGLHLHKVLRYKGNMSYEETRQRRRDWKMSAVFIVTGVFIGILLTVQIKSSIPAATFLSDQLKVQKELVDNYLDEQGLLKTKIVSLRDQIEAAQEKAKQYVQDANLDTLNELKDKVGLKSARGSGVRISLDDGLFVDRDNPDTINQSLVHAADLRDIINVLRSGEATAIAINDQRIIASTPITSVGNTIM